jgi:hypothetical protein
MPINEPYQAANLAMSAFFETSQAPNRLSI